MIGKPPFEAATAEQLLHKHLEAPLPDLVHEISHDLEGIGPSQAYFVRIEDLAGSIPSLPDPPVLGRLGQTIEVVGRGLPYMLGLRRRRRTASAV